MKISCRMILSYISLEKVLFLLILIKSTHEQCLPPNYQCSGAQLCLDSSRVMNSVKDCPQGDDEDPARLDECLLQKDHCDTNAVCANVVGGSYTCTCKTGFFGNGVQCIPQRTNTTAGGSDMETVVPGAVSQFNASTRMPGRCANKDSFDCGDTAVTCIPSTKWRDCQDNCADGSDEWCPMGTVKCGVCKCVTQQLIGKSECTLPLKDKICGFAGSAKCQNGLECVMSAWFMDGHYDCSDGSDENSTYVECYRTGKCLLQNSTSTTSNATGTALSDYDACQKNMLSNALRKYFHPTIGARYVCPCKGGTMADGTGACKNAITGSVRVRATQLCNRNAAFTASMSQTDSDAFNNMAAMLLLGSENLTALSSQTQTFPLMCIPKVAMTSGSINYALTVQCADISSCSLNNLVQSLAIRAASDLMLDTASIAAISCNSKETNNCHQNAQCTSVGLTFNCSCNPGYSDTSSDKSQPGRSCTWSGLSGNPGDSAQNGGNTGTGNSGNVAAAGFGFGLAGNTSCPDKEIPFGDNCITVSLLLVIILLIVLGLCIIGCLIYYFVKKRRDQNKADDVQPLEEVRPRDAWSPTDNNKKKNQQSQSMQPNKNNSKENIGASAISVREAWSPVNGNQKRPSLPVTNARRQSNSSAKEEGQKNSDSNGNKSEANLAGSSTLYNVYRREQTVEDLETARNNDEIMDESNIVHHAQVHSAQSATLAAKTNVPNNKNPNDDNDEYQQWKRRMNLMSPQYATSDNADLLRDYGLYDSSGSSPSPTHASDTRYLATSPSKKRKGKNQPTSYRSQRNAEQERVPSADGLYKESLWWKPKAKKK